MRDPQIQTHKVKKVTDEGMGEYTVHLVNGAFLTVIYDDLPRIPKKGDCIKIQLPIAIDFDDN